ncbi:MAG: hypothetical protein QOF51_2477 [Chloroflexota bacterium]|jgi:predicted peroxiredoxin|nr:hypothetical protein [Chloroflexota bacterium]
MAMQRPIDRLAIEVTRGTSNNLFQVATLVRAATAIDATVEVLFRGDALRKLRVDRINVDEWSAAYAAVQDGLRDRLRSAEFVDMASFLRDAKEHGDRVQYWVDADDLQTAELRLGDLVPQLDGARNSERFFADAERADALLRF